MFMVIQKVFLHGGRSMAMVILASPCLFGRLLGVLKALQVDLGES